jgi:hypothetical protein
VVASVVLAEQQNNSLVILIREVPFDAEESAWT